MKQRISLAVSRFTFGVLVSVSWSTAFGVESNLLAEYINPGPTSDAISSNFGSAVGGNKFRTLVGAPDHDRGGTLNTGGAFAVTSTGFVGALGLTDAVEAGDHLGASISAAKKHYAIGIPGKTLDTHANAGRVFIGHADSSSHYVDNPNPGPDERFGAAVAVYGDLLVIGAPKDSSGGGVPSAGGAYVLNLKTYPGVGPLALVDPDAASGDSFGAAVAISKKYIAVGAPERTVSGLAGVGAVVIFDAKTHVYLGTISNPNLELGSRFGGSLAMGSKLLAIGAPMADRNTGIALAFDIGRVYEYAVSTRTFVRELLPNSGLGGLHFGSSMSTDGKTLVVGIPDEPGLTLSEGLTTSYLLTTGAFIRENVSTHPVTNGRFGAAVGVMTGGNYLVGSPGEQDDLSNPVGRAYLFAKYTRRAR